MIENQPKNIVCINTTCANKEEAISIGLGAIKEKLAISVDYWPVSSIYPWKGVVKEITQYMLVLSTQKMLGEKLTKYIELRHSYSVPVIMQNDTSSTNQLYNFWADNILNSKEEYVTESEAKYRNKILTSSYGYEKLK